MRKPEFYTTKIRVLSVHQMLPLTLPWPPFPWHCKGLCDASAPAMTNITTIRKDCIYKRHIMRRQAGQDFFSFCLISQAGQIFNSLKMKKDFETDNRI
jgi:hypothetical protein